MVADAFRASRRLDRAYGESQSRIPPWQAAAHFAISGAPEPPAYPLARQRDGGPPVSPPPRSRVIEACHGLVEDEHPSLLEHPPHNGQTLALLDGVIKQMT